MGPGLKESSTEAGASGQERPRENSKEPKCKKSGTNMEKTLPTRLKPTVIAGVSVQARLLRSIEAPKFARLRASVAKPRYETLRDDRTNPGRQVSITDRLKAGSNRASPVAGATDPNLDMVWSSNIEPAVARPGAVAGMSMHAEGLNGVAKSNVPRSEAGVGRSEQRHPERSDKKPKQLVSRGNSDASIRMRPGADANELRQPKLRASKNDPKVPTSAADNGETKPTRTRPNRLSELPHLAL